MPDIKTFFLSTIERTQNPLAPLILQEAHSNLDRLGKLLAPLANEATVNNHVDSALSGFMLSEAKLNKLSADPNFLMALCGLLSQSLVSFATKKPQR